MKERKEMFIHTLRLALTTLCFISGAYAQQPQSDMIPGYHHTAEKSLFFADKTAARLKAIEQNGFMKYQGPEGVLATDETTGLTLAVPSTGHDKTSGTPSSADFTSLLDPEEHNRRVLNYFVRAGLPRDQVADIHANTYLSASGPTSKASSTQPHVDGYASIVSRKAGDFLVVDSIAWARMDKRGRVLSEWVYWPPIPSRIIDDARRLNEVLNGRNRSAYLAKLPSAQKNGRVVIRHSSPFAGGNFEAIATYDVMERTESIERSTTASYVRHFDIEGQEIRLPQERRDLRTDYPPKEAAR